MGECTALRSTADGNNAHYHYYERDKGSLIINQHFCILCSLSSLSFTNCAGIITFFCVLQYSTNF